MFSKNRFFEHFQQTAIFGEEKSKLPIDLIVESGKRIESKSKNFSIMTLLHIISIDIRGLDFFV